MPVFHQYLYNLKFFLFSKFSQGDTVSTLLPFYKSEAYTLVWILPPFYIRTYMFLHLLLSFFYRILLIENKNKVKNEHGVIKL